MIENKCHLQKEDHTKTYSDEFKSMISLSQLCERPIHQTMGDFFHEDTLPYSEITDIVCSLAGCNVNNTNLECVLAQSVSPILKKKSIYFIRIYYISNMTQIQILTDLQKEACLILLVHLLSAVIVLLVSKHYCCTDSLNTMKSTTICVQ